MRERIRNIFTPQKRRAYFELRRLSRVPRYTSTTSDIFGSKIHIADSASFVFMYQEIFKREIYRFTAKSPSPLIIDAGANIGLGTLYFKQLYPQSRVIAFEPDPALFEILEKNVQSMGCRDVELHQAAVWKEHGKLSFVREGADAGHLAANGNGSHSTVDAVKMADFLQQPVDLLKVDIEGAETEVLASCSDSLKNVSLLFVEFHSFVGQPQELGRLLEVLRSAGLRVFVESNGYVKHPLIDAASISISNMDLQLNIFGYRDGK